MRRREERAISKHTLNLYAGDHAKLQTIYGTRIGAGKIIRDLVHAHIRKIEEEAQQKLTTPMVEELNVDLEEMNINE